MKKYAKSFMQTSGGFVPSEEQINSFVTLEALQRVFMEIESIDHAAKRTEIGEES